MAIYFWIITVILGAFIIFMMIKEFLEEYSDGAYFIVIIFATSLWLTMGLLPSCIFGINSKQEVVPVENYEVVKSAYSRIIILDKNNLSGTEKNTTLTFEKLADISRIDSLEFSIVKEIEINMWGNVTDESFKIKYK